VTVPRPRDGESTREAPASKVEGKFATVGSGARPRNDPLNKEGSPRGGATVTLREVLHHGAT